MSRNTPAVGEYGYRNRRRRERLLWTLFFLALIAVQCLARFVIRLETFRIVLTVSAILTVLPMANLASPLLASWRYRTPERTVFERAKPYEEKMRLLYDLILTTKEQVIPLDVAAVHPSGGIIGLCPSGKLDTGKAQKGLAALFAKNRLEPPVHIFTDEKRFYQRLDSLKPAASCEDDGTVDYEIRILKSLSM